MGRLQGGAAAAVVMAIMSGVVVGADDAPPQVRRFRHNVVSVAVFAAGNGTEQLPHRSGHGIIIAQTGAQLTVVVPMHVLYGNVDEPRADPVVRVTFPDGDVVMPALALSHMNEAHDLASVSVETPSDYEWCRRCFDARVPDGRRVWAVYRDDDWVSHGQEGVAHLDQPLSDNMRISGLSVAEGASGGAVVGGGGFVGMLLRSTENRADARAVTADAIRRFAHEEGLPWQLSARRAPWKMTAAAVVTIGAYAVLRNQAEQKWMAYESDPALSEGLYSVYYDADQWRKVSGGVAVGAVAGAMYQWMRYWRAQ